MKKFKIHTRTETGMIECPEVTGYTVAVAGFESFSFFVHRQKDAWSVTEASTGQSVVDGHTTKKAAGQAAKLKLANYGIEKFTDLIERSPKMPVAVTLNPPSRKRKGASE